MEYTTVSSSSTDPAALASTLTEKGAEGWHVVAIVPTGGNLTAFLRRTDDGAPAAAAAADTSAPADTAAPAESAPAAPAAAEPAGWGSAPAAAADPAPAAAPVTDYAAQTAAPAAAQAAAPAAGGPPSGWYADPAGRFELRYWDGSVWTEHVSRGGQQFTDPPVA